MIALILATGQAAAAPLLKEQPVPHTVDAELAYLLSFVGLGHTDPQSFDPQRIANTLAFVSAAKRPDVLHVAASRRGTTSAYFELDVRRPLSDVLRLTYDPGLPASITAPSTVRMAQWKEVDTKALAGLWQTLPNLRAVLYVVGFEHLVNTPDEHTNTYYAYDLDRTLLLLPFRKQALFISLSAQRGRSSVGRQGLIIGPDEQWNYVYTGKPGLQWPGLGWVKSYMYDSYSVAFYLGSAAGDSSVRFAIFKWLRAGWAGLNIVNNRHIHDGLRRFGRVFKMIAESPRTFDIDTLSMKFAPLARLPNEQLRRISDNYFRSLKTCFPARDDAKLLEDRNYLATLGRDELLAIAHLEQVKAVLGMPSTFGNPAVDTSRTEDRRP